MNLKGKGYKMIKDNELILFCKSSIQNVSILKKDIGLSDDYEKGWQDAMKKIIKIVEDKKNVLNEKQKKLLNEIAGVNSNGIVTKNYIVSVENFDNWEDLNKLVSKNILSRDKFLSIYIFRITNYGFKLL